MCFYSDLGERWVRICVYVFQIEMSSGLYTEYLYGLLMALPAGERNVFV